MLLRESVPGETGGSEGGVVMEAGSDQARTESPVGSTGEVPDDQELLNWDDLIPTAPPRRGGRIQVLLKKARRDKPLPAEDPWAK